MTSGNEPLDEALSYVSMYLTNAIGQARLHRGRNQDAQCAAILKALAGAAPLVPSDASQRFAKAVAALDEAES